MTGWWCRASTSGWSTGWSLLPDAPETAFLSTFGLDPLDALAIAADHGHRGLHPDVGLLGGDVAPRLIERAHGLGLAVRPWTVNDPADVARLGALGVDAVISDDPVVGARRARDLTLRPGPSGRDEGEAVGLVAHVEVLGRPEVVAVDLPRERRGCADRPAR